MAQRPSRLVLALLLGGFVLVAPAARAQQLNAYWAADGTLTDASGNGNTLTNNGATFGPGEYGQAFELNGNSSYLADPSPSFNLLGSNFSISLWANFNSFNGNAAGRLPNTFIGEDQGSGIEEKWVFYYDASDKSLGFHVNGAAGSDFAEAPLTNAPVTNQWNMFTVTGNTSAGSLSFYYDGQFLGTKIGVPFSNPSTAITIGEAEGIGYFDGGLDDIRIYNSELSASQVNSLFNNAPVPEASTTVSLGLLLAFGMGGLIVMGKRKKA